MAEFLYNTLMNRWPEILGLMLTLCSGFLVPWISKKSGNYKKLNKQMMGICLLHLFYISIVPLITSTIGVAILVIVLTIVEVEASILAAGIAYFFVIVWTLAMLYVVMRKSKRMVLMMNRARAINKWLYLMLWWVVIASIILSSVNLTFIGSPYEADVTRVALVISWVFQFWWLGLVMYLVWKASDYVYSKIKITMMDGEIFYFDCSPKVCRVYKNYIRIMKRDENDVVIQELQINEIAIKQIEYEK
ncbi:MAG: hypothetical protein FWE11_06190 [Defluviitaleaceae bacterium]|nr:hypothetical protein [Defluviitaleaceae bacterium]